MARKIADQGIAALTREVFDLKPDFADGCLVTDNLDPGPHGFFAIVAQFDQFGFSRTTDKAGSSIGKIPIKGSGNINVNQVTIRKNLIAGNAMGNSFVDAERHRRLQEPFAR